MPPPGAVAEPVFGDTTTEPPTESGAERRCIVTGTLAERATLLRFVVGPDGTAVPDVEARLPGRGLWVTPRRDIVDRAVAKRFFSRAARRQVAAAPDLADRVEALLARRCGESLGLARRAGLAVAGFDRVAEAVRHGETALLLLALDGAEAGRRKIAGIDRELPWEAVLSGAELGAAFGRERVAHVAIGGGPLCRRLQQEVLRLAGFRSGASTSRGITTASAGPIRQDGGNEPND